MHKIVQYHLTITLTLGNNFKIQEQKRLKEPLVRK